MHNNGRRGTKPSSGSPARSKHDEHDSKSRPYPDEPCQAEAHWLHAEAVAQIGTWRHDVAGRELHWSSGLYAIFGREPGAVPPDAAHDSWGCDAEERGRLREMLHALEDHPRDFEFSTRILRPDGIVREVLVRGTCEVDASTQAARSVFGVCIDVTDLRDVERRLQDSERPFRLLVESVEDYAIYMLDPHGRVTNWNAGAQRAKGYTADEIVGAHFAIFYTPEDREKGLPMAALEAAAAAGRFASEGWRVRKDGSRFWTMISITPVRGADGTLIGFAKVTRDIGARRQAEAELRASEARYRLLADHVTDMIVQGDMDTTRRYVSPASREVLGYEPEELVGLMPLDSAHPDETESYAKLLKQIVDGPADRTTIRRRYRRKDGSYVWVEAIVRLLRDVETGEATGYVSSVRDISDRKAVEEELRQKTVLLDQTLDNMDQGLMMTDADDVVKVYNRQLRTLLALPETLLEPGATFSRIAHYMEERGDVQVSVETIDEEHLAGEQLCADGSILEVRTARLAGGGCVRTYTDVTARRQAEQRAEHMAKHDALTGLPNRRAFHEHLAQELLRLEPRTAGCAVLCLDLDRFKAVNDSFGHHAGDLLLKTVAARIGTAVGLSGTVARLGGDEFAVLLPDPSDNGVVGTLAQSLIDAICRPIDVGGSFVTIGLSIGVAVGIPQQDPDQMVRNADLALYRAKAAGRNTFRFHEPDMDRANADRLRLEIDLSEALASQQFRLNYQPIVDPIGRRVVGFEALLRWQHPERGLISPSRFIPLAEETGLITPIGTWALGEACQVAARWPQDLRISVNVSAIQLRQPNFEQVVVAALARSSLPAERLELEITETVLLSYSEAVMERLARLRALGVRVALDDFGTGYSSLHYLNQLQLDRIKIDRCFIQRIDEPSTAAIVKAVVQIASHKGCTVIAEGVETEAQADRVLDAGCTEIQGYLYGAPVEADRLEAELHRIARLLSPRRRRRKGAQAA